MQYLTSAFLGHAISGDLLGAFNSALGAHSFNLKRYFKTQVTMDCPSVNLVFLAELKHFLENCENAADPGLDIGTCSLHVVYGA